MCVSTWQALRGVKEFGSVTTGCLYVCFTQAAASQVGLLFKIQTKITHKTHLCKIKRSNWWNLECKQPKNTTSTNSPTSNKSHLQNTVMSSAGVHGGGPCGACKFLRRKCVKGCIFAPYFDSEQGAAHFAAVHKVFGASNASKLLLRIPANKRLDACVTLCYEALARVRDPVYGCVAHIFSLQQQVSSSNVTQISPKFL